MSVLISDREELLMQLSKGNLLQKCDAALNLARAGEATDEIVAALESASKIGHPRLQEAAVWALGVLENGSEEEARERIRLARYAIPAEVHLHSLTDIYALARLHAC